MGFELFIFCSVKNKNVCICLESIMREKGIGQKLKAAQRE